MKRKTWDPPILGSFIFDRRDLFLFMFDSNLSVVLCILFHEDDAKYSFHDRHL